MKDLKLTNDGDISINQSNGNVDIVSDYDDLIQQIQTSLNINIGELSWNRDIGIDFNELLVNGRRESIINDILSNYLRNRFNDTFNSLNITQFDIDHKYRVLYLTADININNSDGSISTLTVNNSIGGE